MCMRINGPFIRALAENINKSNTLYTFLMYRYRISETSCGQIRNFIKYFAANAKEPSLSFDVIDKCYNEWQKNGTDKIIEVSNKDVDKAENRILSFIGVQKIESLSVENKHIHNSFLDSNDSSQFYVYVGEIDLFYCFLYSWSKRELRQYAKALNIPEDEILCFDDMSNTLYCPEHIIRPTNEHINKCMESFFKLYSLEGYEFNENSAIEKASIMNVLAMISDFVQQFIESISCIIYYMSSFHFKTDTILDSYLIPMMYLSLSEKSELMKKEYDVNENPIIKDVSRGEEQTWCLPENYFELPTADKNEYFGDIKAVAKDVDSFECLINYLAAEGYIEYNDNSKRILAFVLTGKSKPNVKIEKIEWKKSCNDLAYICRHFYNFNGRYNRIPNFFRYEGDNKPLRSNYADNASKNLQEKINELFPTLEKSK